MILLDCDDLCRCGGMVDAIDSKSIIRKDVEVRVLSSALVVKDKFATLFSKQRLWYKAQKEKRTSYMWEVRFFTRKSLVVFK